MGNIPFEKISRERFSDLRNMLIEFLSRGTWSIIEETFSRAELEWRPDLGPGSGKPQYVDRVLAEFSKDKIIELAKKCIREFPTREIYEIQDALWWYQSTEKNNLSQVTRSRLLESLEGYRLHISVEPIEFLKTLPQFQRLAPHLPTLYYADNNQLMRKPAFLDIGVPDATCSYREFFEEWGFSKWSDPRVFEFFERLVYPEVREENEQAKLVASLNEHLKRDGFELRCTSYVSGYPVYSVVALTTASSESPKYLVFGSNGPKPEIGFEDVVGNRITILKYEESCLVYDRPIDPNLGLSWEDLVKWWQQSKYFEQTGGDDPIVAGEKHSGKDRSAPYPARYFTPVLGARGKHG